MMDDIDRSILDHMVADAWLGYKALGALIGRSASATQRRVERLKKEGYLLGARAVLSPSAQSRSLRIYMLLELENDSKSALDGLSADLRAFPGFEDARVTVGATDVIVTLDCVSMEEFQDWSMTAINENRNVRHCTTLVNLKQL